jgi:hypothetical protein
MIWGPLAPYPASECRPVLHTGSRKTKNGGVTIFAQESGGNQIAIYAPLIYTTPYVMFLMRADPLRGQVGGGWALENETFLVSRARIKNIMYGAI